MATFAQPISRDFVIEDDFGGLGSSLPGGPGTGDSRGFLPTDDFFRRFFPDGPTGTGTTQQSLFDRGFEGLFEDIFLPEYQRRQERLPGLEEQFLGQLGQSPDLSNPFLSQLEELFGQQGGMGSIDPGIGNVGSVGSNEFLGIAQQLLQSPDEVESLSAASREVGRSVSEDLFRTGGEVDQATQQALRASVEAGFGPASGGFDRARLSILDNATGRTASAIGQAFPQVFGQALQSATGAGTAIRGQDTQRAISSAQNRIRAALGNQQIQSQQLGVLGNVGLGLAELEQGAHQFGVSSLGGFLGQEQQLQEADRSSLAGLYGQEQQLGLARETQEQNRRLLEQALESGDPSAIKSALSGALGGAATGAGIGSIVPGIGTGIGAAVGGGIGFLGGLF